jgi:lipopolysaccharide biosynthesis glycosyltransferase
MGATIASLLRANPNHAFRLFVCSTNRNPTAELHISEILSRFGNASVKFLTFDPSRQAGQLNQAIYLRLFLTEFLDPSIEKVLYLDCDLIICGDVGELWQTDLAGAFLAAVPEPYFAKHVGFEPGESYFNSGVLVIDVAQWRAANCLQEFLRFAEQHASNLAAYDQDILNNTFRGKILSLDYRWNFQTSFADVPPKALGLSPEVFWKLRQRPTIVHFTGKYKPWFYSYQPHYKRLYYDALALTPWRSYRPPDLKLRSVFVRLKTLTYLRERINWFLPDLAGWGRKLLGRRSRIDIDPTIA